MYNSLTIEKANDSQTNVFNYLNTPISTRCKITFCILHNSSGSVYSFCYRWPLPQPVSFAYQIFARDFWRAVKYQPLNLYPFTVGERSSQNFARCKKLAKRMGSVGISRNRKARKISIVQERSGLGNDQMIVCITSLQQLTFTVVQKRHRKHTKAETKS